MSHSFNTTEEIYQHYDKFPFACTDTRKITRNSIFFCLKGENFDGNTFALQALENGAQFVVTENVELIANPKCLVVQNVLLSLQNLATFHRQKLKIPIIGITGTNGKTTTKELVNAVLSKKYKTVCTQGNLNNHIGVPLTLLTINEDDEVAIIEMGASHVGEIAELCQIALPNYGIVTNIGKAHLDGFGSVENIRATKLALYQATETWFLNSELENQFTLPDYKNKTIVRFGKETNIEGKIVSNNPYLSINLFNQLIHTKLTGSYNLANLEASAAVGKYFNISEIDICNAISNYIPTNNRSQIINNETNTIIADYYNANPTSMLAALENLIQIDAENKLAILGDMLELGEVSKKEHQLIIEVCKSNNLQAFFVGNLFNELINNDFQFFKSTGDLNLFLQKHKISETTILLKGSRGIHLENVVI